MDAERSQSFKASTNNREVISENNFGVNLIREMDGLRSVINLRAERNETQK